MCIVGSKNQDEEHTFPWWLIMNSQHGIGKVESVRFKNLIET